jgi:hypothetical protein
MTGVLPQQGHKIRINRTQKEIQLGCPLRGKRGGIKPTIFAGRDVAPCSVSDQNAADLQRSALVGPSRFALRDKRRGAQQK